MKIGLIDVDSKIPNLALMKLSAYHKAKGDGVSLVGPLFAGGFDLVYASKVFDFSEMPILPEGAVIGGSGVDLQKKLPEEIENIYPDYSIYGCDYAMGFTSRGCNRRCPFCIVPKKEGRFRVVADIGQFWTGQKELVLLDNSINTDEDHFVSVMRDARKHEISVEITQGMDIRYLTERQAKELIATKRKRSCIHFAWDSPETEPAVIKGINILKKYIQTRFITFYVLIGYDTTPKEDLHRVETLKSYRVNPFIMKWNKDDPYQMEFARWVNRPEIFWSSTWGDYSGNRFG